MYYLNVFRSSPCFQNIWIHRNNGYQRGVQAVPCQYKYLELAGSLNICTEREREREPQLKLHLPTIHKALSSKFAFSIYILNFLWSYVLSLCQLENVLLSVPTLTSISIKNAESYTCSKIWVPNSNQKNIGYINTSFSVNSYFIGRSKSF